MLQVSKEDIPYNSLLFLFLITNKLYRISFLFAYLPAVSAGQLMGVQLSDTRRSGNIMEFMMIT